MEIDKTIKIAVNYGTLEIKIRNILDVKEFPGYAKLVYWDPDEDRKELLHIFDAPATWYDKDGSKSTDYRKLIDTLKVYAEQTKLKDAIAGLA